MRYLLISFFLAGAFFQSCSGDVDEAATITYNGRRFDFNTGYRLSDPLLLMTPDQSTYYLQTIFLTTDGITPSDQNLIGKGDYLRLAFITESKEIKPGTYSFSKRSVPFGITQASLTCDADIAAKEGTEVHAESGTVAIRKNSGNYALKFNLVAGGKLIKGQWNGELEPVDF